MVKLFGRLASLFTSKRGKNKEHVAGNLFAARRCGVVLESQSECVKVSDSVSGIQLLFMDIVSKYAGDQRLIGVAISKLYVSNKLRRLFRKNDISYLSDFFDMDMNSLNGFDRNALHRIKEAIEVYLKTQSDSVSKIVNVKSDDYNLKALILRSNCSVRLTNIAHRSLDDFEIQSIEQYVNTPNAAEKFLKIPGFGRKCANELDDLVFRSDLIGDMLAKPVLVQESSLEKFEKLLEAIFRMFDEISISKITTIVDLSSRTKNFLSQLGLEEYSCEYRNFGVILRDKHTAVEALKKTKGIGRKSISELLVSVEKIVERSLVRAGLDQAIIDYIVVSRSIKEQDYNNLDLDKELSKLELFDLAGWLEKGPNVEGFLNDIGFEINTANTLSNNIVLLLQALLKSKECDVMIKRFGIGRNKMTLEEVGALYGVTRERIRQIEQKALIVLKHHSKRKIFKTIINYEAESYKGLFEKGSDFISISLAKELYENASSELKFLATIAVKGFPEIVSEFYEPLLSGKKIVGWLINKQYPKGEALAYLIHNQINISSLKSIIIELLNREHWPLTIDKINNLYPDLSEEMIVNFLSNELRSEVRDRKIYITASMLPVKTKVIISLRSLGKPSHLSDIRAAYNNLFHEDQSEHNIGAVLARLDEALIVDRGIYGLYEHLSLNMDEVKQVANYAFKALEEAETFLSSKIIYKRLTNDFPLLRGRVTSYMILGICQDDDRFLYNRGSMIGLNKKGFSEEFNSLTDTVLSCFENPGPFTIANIQEQIKDTRDVLDMTIFKILNDANTIVRVSRTEYDLIKRVIGDHKLLEDIKLALQISLIDGSASLPVISNRLRSVNIKLDNYTILSLMEKSQNFFRERNLFSITVLSEPLKHYNNVYSMLTSGQIDEQEYLNLVKSSDFRNLDFREHVEHITEESKENDLLESILDEFDF